MEMQEMEITIDRDGRIAVKVNGAHGADCLAVTKNLEEAAGVVEERIYSAEYYEQPATIRDYQQLSRR
jgi:hypothetical protein